MPLQDVEVLSDDEQFQSPEAKPSKPGGGDGMPPPPKKTKKKKSESDVPASQSDLLPEETQPEAEEPEKDPPAAKQKAKAKAKSKAKAKAAGKAGMKKPSASLKRPAASTPEIKTHKNFYKKGNRFGIKVTPPGRELVYASWLNGFDQCDVNCFHYFSLFGSTCNVLVCTQVRYRDGLSYDKQNEICESYFNLEFHNWMAIILNTQRLLHMTFSEIVGQLLDQVAMF